MRQIMRGYTDYSSRFIHKFSKTTMVYSALTKENNDRFEGNIRNSIFSIKGVQPKEFLYGNQRILYAN